MSNMQKQFKWDTINDGLIRSKWDKKGGKIYTYLMDQVHKGKVSHDFMKDEDYNKLRAIWDGEKFKKISEIMKANRNGDSGGLGGSRHSGGSIPATMHKRKLVTFLIFSTSIQVYENNLF